MLWSNFSTALIMGAFTGIISAYIAHRRERNPLSWFIIGFLFGLLGLLLFFFIPSAKKKKPPIANLKPIPQPYIFGPSDKFWYYLDSAHQQVGPMSYSAMSSEWKQGKVQPHMFVWHEDLPDWRQLQELIRT